MSQISSNCTANAESLTSLPRPIVSDLVALTKWLREIDKTAATGWRWRKLGYITTTNILGRLYVSREAIAKFERRAAAGEFSQVHKTPSKKGEK